MEATRFSRGKLTFACCAGLFSCGLVNALIGVSLDSLALQVGRKATEVGGPFFFFIGLAAFMMIFGSGPLIDRFGKKPVLVAASAFSVLGMLLLGRIGSLKAACGVMFVLGAGVGGMSSGVNTLINDLYPENPDRWLNLVNVFFGLGAVFMPFLATWLFFIAGLRHLFMITAALCFVPGLFFVLSLFPPPTEGLKFRFGDAGKAVSDPLVKLFALLLFFYVGLEASLGTWSRVAVVEHWETRAPYDQTILAGYWASLLFGRLLAGTVLRSIPSHKLVLFCALGAFCALTGFVLAPSVAAASAMLWLCGLCFAPIFPSSLGSAGRIFKRYTGTIFAMIISGGVLGSMAVTYLIGEAAHATSLATGLWVASLAGLLMLTMQIMIFSRIKKRLPS